ncbi:hypothetical protein TPA0906_62200 [Streptomyces olivaceus]|uniref:hypothetical protein n=1 Tax=Streptomyces TaxID=1883 RepID=UPI001413C5E8|nr:MULTISPECIES: hypothetical protein [Streptomyces]MBZ6207426.1 hypothetical protein [Streptomyces olivaceus]MBZ6290278.1 hypothetical protein [Streptomyces olivaceus]MBZ6324230.1 hypothetical protein [Streptomyces olivaceus]QIP69400.1 hypothetical protein EZV63_05475 [Streptomyces sp. VN1]GHJ04355.1 hypothetical protein TPA0906_62200 [Streptomyces olivaceus]
MAAASQLPADGRAGGPTLPQNEGTTAAQAEGRGNGEGSALYVSGFGARHAHTAVRPRPGALRRAPRSASM